MKTIPGIDPKFTIQISHLFDTLPGKSQVVLFGSRAKGNFREGSDIDLALKGDLLGLEHRDAILLKYDDIDLPWKLDLVIYRLISEPLLKEHIDRVGVVLLEIP